MARTPASRIQRVQPPATLAAGEKARQLARQGHDVIDLGQSSPHHVTPPHIVEAGVNALNRGLTNISSSRGLPELRQAMSDKLAAHNSRAVDPDRDILITPGSKMGLYAAINAYIERGDEALVIEPTWVSFSQQVEMAEGHSCGRAPERGRGILHHLRASQGIRYAPVKDAHHQQPQQPHGPRLYPG